MKRTNQSRRFEQQAQAALARGDLQGAEDAFWFAQLGAPGPDKENLRQRQERVAATRRMMEVADGQ